MRNPRGCSRTSATCANHRLLPSEWLTQNIPRTLPRWQDSCRARSVAQHVQQHGHSWPIPFQMRNAVLTNRSGTLRYLAFTSCHRNSTGGAGQPFAMADNVALGSRAWNRSGLSEYVSRALARGANHAPAGAPGRPRRFEPGGVHQYMAHHGRAVTRVLDLPAAVINVYLEVNIALWPASSPFWPASCCWTGSGPHGCCARPAVDLGVGEDHAWAGTVRSARNPAR